MKKLALFLFLILTTASLTAQTTVSMAADTAGTIAGVDASGRTHYFTSPQITNGYIAWTLEVYITASGTHATDSTHIVLQASMDGTNYFQLTDLGTPYMVGYAAYNSTALPTTIGKRYSSSGATAGWAWKVTTPLPYRYVRVKVTQYKAASILTVNRCKLHLYK